MARRTSSSILPPDNSGRGSPANDGNAVRALFRSAQRRRGIERRPSGNRFRQRQSFEFRILRLQLRDVVCALRQSFEALGARVIRNRNADLRSDNAPHGDLAVPFRDVLMNVIVGKARQAFVLLDGDNFGLIRRRCGQTRCRRFRGSSSKHPDLHVAETGGRCAMARAHRLHRLAFAAIRSSPQLPVLLVRRSHRTKFQNSGVMPA